MQLRGGAPACVTVNLWSPTTIVPTRALPRRDCGATLKPTVPSPLPVTGVVNEIQLASVAAVHEQPLVADTATCCGTPAGIDGEAARPEFESGRPPPAATAAGGCR